MTAPSPGQSPPHESSGASSNVPRTCARTLWRRRPPSTAVAGERRLAVLPRPPGRDPGLALADRLAGRAAVAHRTRTRPADRLVGHPVPLDVRTDRLRHGAPVHGPVHRLVLRPPRPDRHEDPGSG